MLHMCRAFESHGLGYTASVLVLGRVHACRPAALQPIATPLDTREIGGTCLGGVDEGSSNVRSCALDLLDLERLDPRDSPARDRHHGDDVELKDTSSCEVGSEVPRGVHPAVRTERERLPDYRERNDVGGGACEFAHSGQSVIVHLEIVREHRARASAVVFVERLVELDERLRKRCKSMNVPTPPRRYWSEPGTATGADDRHYLA